MIRGDDDDFFAEPVTEINVTPFVDVMLVLLIVFMVAAPLMTAGVPVQLPSTKAARSEEPRQAIIVTVDKDGALWIDREMLADDGLASRLAVLAQADPARPVLWTRASLTRRVELYDPAGFYA
jgi:biopolymer transport protein ExbD